MKITKNQLRRIIREEKVKVLTEVGPDYSPEDLEDERYMNAMSDLYEAFEQALAAAKSAGIDYPDMMTAFDDSKESVGY